MCGIIGIWGALPDKDAILRDGCRRIAHRGPDSQGLWSDARSGLTLAHVRLAILDLSAAGHQPMVSACGRFVLVLNGEIYNHMDLRLQLEKSGSAPDWRGHSDTETLLACFSSWGIEATLQATVGMFAVALWDRESQQLTLARDRMGEKPLFYGYAAGNLVFASELKALMPIPGFGAALSREALTLLMRHNYVPAPWSIYDGIFKLTPGTWLTLSEADMMQRRLPEPRVYWSALDVADAAQAAGHRYGSDAEATDALEAVLTQAVGGQMISDVGLGAFLSGGIDSSTIVALMQKQSAQAVRTFSIGFHEKGYDEAEHAKAVAKHLGCAHTELYVTSQDALNIVPHLADIYDEPFADASQIPTSLVTRMARQHVTVALSGDGGDELFGGYSRYLRVKKWWAQFGKIPRLVRTPMGVALSLSAQLPGNGAWHGKVAKMGGMLRAKTHGDFYRHFVSYWNEPTQIVLGGTQPPTPFSQSLRGSTLDAMMKLDAITYLPDDILVKVDRAAMAVSLETRVPLLDHRVYAFAWGLPAKYKVRGNTGKWLLKQVLYRHVPQAMVDRPKRGFSVPMAQWLRGPLREWADDLLDESRLRQQGIFAPEPIVRKWREHTSGHRNWGPDLWGVLMTQAWLKRYREGIDTKESDV